MQDVELIREAVGKVLGGSAKFAIIGAEGRLLSTSSTPRQDNIGHNKPSNETPYLIMSGSYNPLHDGHIRMAQVASDICKPPKPLMFELPAVNADKPPLPLDTVIQRIEQFVGRWPIAITRCPTFAEKARVFPGSTFIVGMDTATRI